MLARRSKLNIVTMALAGAALGAANLAVNAQMFAPTRPAGVNGYFGANAFTANRGVLGYFPAFSQMASRLPGAATGTSTIGPFGPVTRPPLPFDQPVFITGAGGNIGVNAVRPPLPFNQPVFITQPATVSGPFGPMVRPPLPFNQPVFVTSAGRR